jgi:hypothetical protein
VEGRSAAKVPRQRPDRRGRPGSSPDVVAASSVCLARVAAVTELELGGWAITLLPLIRRGVGPVCGATTEPVVLPKTRRPYQPKVTTSDQRTPLSDGRPVLRRVSGRAAGPATRYCSGWARARSRRGLLAQQIPPSLGA